MKYGVNIAIVIGTIKELEFSQQSNDKRFYHGRLSCERLSGTSDEIRFIIEENVLKEIGFDYEGKRVQIRGQYLSHNERIEGTEGSHLKLFVSVQNIMEVEVSTPAKNELVLEGYLCKTPIVRETPRGVKICDLMIAINRRSHGKSIASYIPCICFGDLAVYMGDQPMGSELTIRGRIQSRAYTKRTAEGTMMERIAYEIAAYRIQVENDELQ